jgi:cell division protein FtsB
MATVKGSKQQKMIVVPYRPWKTAWAQGSLIALIVLTGVVAYFAGFGKGVDENGDARIERDGLRTEVAALQVSNTALNQQILNLEQASNVDKEALNSVQQTILSLREQISQLEEDVLFYKEILSPDNQEDGLVIGQLDLMATDNPSNIRFKLELKQQGSNEDLISGYANVNILGMQDSQEVSIPLRSMTDVVDSLDIRLKFRYFQNIEGVMVLPEGFEPQKVQILAVAEGESAKTVQKSFGWLVRN